MSSGFVTEAEVEEAKRRRQEEWEKVRQPDEPLEVSESIVFGQFCGKSFKDIQRQYFLLVRHPNPLSTIAPSTTDSKSRNREKT